MTEVADNRVAIRSTISTTERVFPAIDGFPVMTIPAGDIVFSS